MVTQEIDGLAKAGTRRGHLPLITSIIGAALGVTFGWSAGHTAAGIGGLMEAPGTGSSTAAIDAPKATVDARGRALVVNIPEDDTYVDSSSVAVAGTAFGRPHAPAIQVVRVEIIAGGRSIGSADLDVFSGRFAGVVEADVASRTTAELRVTDPRHPGREALVKRLTIDPR